MEKRKIHCINGLWANHKCLKHFWRLEMPCLYLNSIAISAHFLHTYSVQGVLLLGVESWNSIERTQFWIIFLLVKGLLLRWRHSEKKKKGKRVFDACPTYVKSQLKLYVFVLWHTGQLSGSVWRNTFCQSAVVYPCPLHSHPALSKGEDTKKGILLFNCPFPGSCRQQMHHTLIK